MKERKLTILLALLAALALVFAGACSDGSDDDGSADTPASNGNVDDGNTPSGNDSPSSSGNEDEDTFSLSSVIVGTEWTYSSGVDVSSGGVSSVTLVFGELTGSSGNVTLTASGKNSSDVTDGEPQDGGSGYDATVTYTVNDSANTVTITSSSSSNGSSLDESAVIVLALDNDSISVKTLSAEDNSESTLTVSNITTSTGSGDAALTVVASSNTLDILGSEVSGKLTDTGTPSVFNCTSTGSSDDTNGQSS